MLRCGGDDDVGESWGVALATRPIGHRSGDPRRWRIESKNAIAVEVQHRLQPCRQIRTLARRSLAHQFGDSGNHIQ